MVQTINLYGMSVDKFRRMLKVLIAEHIYDNEAMSVLHNTPLKLCSKKEYNTYFKPLLRSQLALALEDFGVFKEDPASREMHLDQVVD